MNQEWESGQINDAAVTYAIECGERATERRVSVDVEIGNRQYVADAIVTSYPDNDFHVWWLRVRRLGDGNDEREPGSDDV